MTGSREKNVDFTRGNIPSVVMSMAVPLILAQLVNVLYNIVDRIYIGHIPGVGAYALTGVGVALPIITILAAFAGLFGQGGAPLFSIALGGRDAEGAGRIMGNSMTLLLTSSLLLTALFQWIARPALLALGAGENTVEFGLAYLRLYLLGTPLSFITLGMTPYLNAQGFARRGMMTVMLGAGANILLDPVFIFALGMGVRGAALATVLSQALSAAWCLWFLLGKRVPVPLRSRNMRLHAQTVGRIVSMGVANFFAQGTNSVVHAVVNRQLALFGGDLFVGAMTVINSMRTVMQEIVHGLTVGSQPVLGFNYGAGEKKRVLDCIRFVSLVCTGFLVLIWVLFEVFAEPFVRFFTSDEALVAVTVPSVRIYFSGIVFMALQSIGQSTFQGLGRAKQAVSFSLLRKIVIIVPLVLLLPGPLGLGVNGVFWSEPISDLLGGSASFLTMLFTVYLPVKRQLREETKCKN